MSAKTQDLKGVLETADNLYEAAIVIGRRARQINEEHYQKKRDHQILEELEGGFDDEFMQMDQEEIDSKIAAETEENPIIIAQREFYEGKLDFHYETPRR